MSIHRLLAAASAASVILLAACEGARGVEGTWDARQQERYTVEFRSDSTFLMTAGTFIGTGTYEVDGRQVKLEPTGALAASVPAGYTGTLAGDTLNMCAPNGICTNFYRR